MYVKINDCIFYRQLGEYGYLSDNSAFGYKFINDNIPNIGERYLSESASVMVSLLSKEYQDVEVVIRKMMNIFVDVEYDELKNDALELYFKLNNEGFLTIKDINGNIVDDSLKELSDEQDDSENNDFIVKNHLKSVHIEVANACNERCVHCYIPHEDKTDFIRSDLFYKVIDDCIKMNVINITISGGEPLLHNDIIGFLKKCRESDMSVNILTNLTLLTDEILEEMIKNPLLCVQTSLYSMNSTIHDSITTVKGSFEKTKNNILKLISKGIPVQISCPIMKQNMDTFFDVYLWGKEHNVYVAYDYVIFASYNHNDDNLKNRLTTDEIKIAFRRQINDETLDIILNKKADKCSLLPYEPICSICRHYLCVSAHGKVFPCVGWQNNILGDINCDSINNIWNNSEIVNSLRNVSLSSFHKCEKCDDRGYCTICMMSNSNENEDGNWFRIKDYHCQVAKIIHNEVNNYLKSKENKQ